MRLIEIEQLSAIESVISKGGKVAEKQVVNLTELLMNELLKLDGIVADGDVKLQRRLQVDMSLIELLAFVFLDEESNLILCHIF